MEQKSKRRINYNQGRGLSKVRKPVRFKLAKRAVIAAVAGVLTLLAGYTLYSQKEPLVASLEEFVASTVDAKVEHILVEGVTYTDPQELLEAIAMKKGDSLVGFEAGATRKRVEGITWVRLATVARQLPDTVKVNVTEYKPAARLIEGDEAWVITKDGFQIAGVDARFDHLPVLAGDGVSEEGANLFALLAPHPDLQAEMIKATLVGGRRWDVQFSSGVTVQLPEEKPEGALLLLLRLQQERDVLNMNGGSVDLRLEDRIIIREPEAANHSFSRHERRA